jgi:hypothetical protein
MSVTVMKPGDRVEISLYIGEILDAIVSAVIPDKKRCRIFILSFSFALRVEETPGCSLGAQAGGTYCIREFGLDFQLMFSKWP